MSCRGVAGIPVCLGLLLLPLGAIGQSTDDEEVIVTARKRQEETLRVPVVASVLDDEKIDNHQVSDLFDVATLTPGLILGVSSIEVGTEISLRGVGSSSLDPGIDQSVALNLDGLQLGQGAAYSVGYLDLARIEILKGPQSLFFGKNSPGGVVAIRSADPGENFELIGNVANEFETNERRAQLILSGPVTNTLGLRLASQYISSDGYFRNTAVALPDTGAQQPSGNFGEKESLYLRLTALFRPSEEFSAKLKLNVTDDRSLGGVQEQLIYCPDGTANYLPTIGIPLPSMYSASEDCRADQRLNIVDLDPRYFRGATNDGVPFTETDQRFGTLEMNWFAPALELTSLTSYYDLHVEGLQNGPWTGGAGPPLAVIKDFRREEATQELRLSSDLDGAFDFTAGAFFQDANVQSDISVPGNILYGLPAVVLQGSHDLDVRSLSLFGQVRFRPAAKFEIAGGARWTDEKRSDAPVTFDVNGVLTGAQGTPLMPEVPDLRSRNWSPELTVSWFPNDSLTIFGSLKQGYKSGSYNIILPINPGTDNAFDDERVRGGEIGAKAYLAERQVFLDLAAYHYRYTGMQVGITQISANGIPNLTTFNAGEAKVYGVDLALRYRPDAIAGLAFSGAVNWNHGRFTRFVNAPCYPGQVVDEGCILLPSPVTDPNEIAAGYYSIDPASGLPVRYNAQNLSGTPLPRAPEWQASFDVDYDRPIGRNLALGVGAGVQSSSKYVIDLGRRDHGFQQAFAKLGANVRLSSRDDQWEVALIGQNLSNELTSGGCYDINYAGGSVFPGIITGAPILGPAGSGEILCGYDGGRELWLRLTLRPFPRE